MAVTIAKLTKSTLRELNEATNSSLGAVGDGTGVDSVTTLETLYDYWTQANNEWCETAYPLFGSGTITWPIGDKAKGWQNFTYPSGQGRLFAARSVGAGSTLVALDRIGLGTLKGNFPGYEFVADGVPIYYYEEPSLIGLYPAPSAATAVKVYGLCVPPVVDNTTTSLSFMPDDLIERVIPLATAILLAMKAFDDPSVFGRLDHLIARYVALRDRYRMGVSEELRVHLRLPEIQRRGK